jgi:hypothetical protein
MVELSVCPDTMASGMAASAAWISGFEKITTLRRSHSVGHGEDASGVLVGEEFSR